MRQWWPRSDHDAPAKQEIALGLVESARIEGWGVVSTQVLQEYYAAATRKLGVPPEIARAKLEIFGRLDVAMIDLAGILAGIDVHRLHGGRESVRLIGGSSTVMSPGERESGRHVRHPPPLCPNAAVTAYCVPAFCMLSRT